MPEDENENELPQEVIAEEPEEGMPGCPGWMVTFGDAISLLMTFFVLILAFSDLSPDTPDKLTKLFVRNGGGGGDIKVVGGQSGSAIGGAQSSGDGTGEGANFDEMKKELEAETLEMSEQNSYSINTSMEQMQEFFSEEGAQEAKEEIAMQSTESKESFSLEFDQDFAFSLGRANFQAASKKALDKIGSLIADLPNDIVITGYANDFNKIAYPLYPSNLNLAVARANAIAQFFITAWNVEPERIGIKVVEDLDKDTNGKSGKTTTSSAIKINIASTFDGYVRKELKKHEFK